MVADRGRVGSLTRNQKIERVWRDVFRCVCDVFYYTFYAMEQTGFWMYKSHLHVHVAVCLFKKNKLCFMWMGLFQWPASPDQTEHNWSQNQMWWNGMRNACNPLDDDPEDITFYGEDHEGQTPWRVWLKRWGVPCSAIKHQWWWTHNPYM